MKIEWIGHACFKLTAQDGTVVITDPYDESVGIDMLPLEADLITMSHSHHDHCEESMIVGHPVIARGTQTACVGGVTSEAVLSWHDDAQGKLRGENAIRIFAIDGLKVVHMGDQGCMPDDDAMEKIAGADVMMIPVGGTYTVDAQGAKAIIERAKPACIIPMHVKTKRCPYPIVPMHQALAALGAVDAKPCDALTVGKEGLPCGVALMQPKADEL